MRQGETVDAVIIGAGVIGCSIALALSRRGFDTLNVEALPDVDGHFMAIGASGNQFKNAPVVGELMAELIEACGQGRDHDADPVSFHLRHIGRDLSLRPFPEIGRSTRTAVFPSSDE